jgi:hypothetical protein
MSRREDETVSVDPAGVMRAVLEGVPVEDGANFGRAEREAEVAGFAGSDGINGQAASVTTG